MGNESQPETDFFLSLVLKLMFNSKCLNEFTEQGCNNDVETEPLKGGRIGLVAEEEEYYCHDASGQVDSFQLWSSEVCTI